MIYGQRGFTLVEMMIATAISAVVVLGAIQLMVWQTQLQATTNSSIGLNGDVLLLEDYFSRQIAEGGGNSLTPWSAFWVEDNCAARAIFPTCNGTDRLTIVDSNVSTNCSILKSVPSGSGTNLTFSNGASGCCISNTDFSSGQVMLTNGSTFAQRAISSVNATNCVAYVVNGPSSAHDNAPAGFNWLGGIVAPVTLTTFYVDPTTNELHQYIYSNGINGIDSVLADQIYDFQVSLGFDFNPSDGVVTDNGNSTDEWLYNDPVNAEAWGAGVFASMPSSSLEMVGIGIISGYMNPKNSQSISGTQVLNGPARNVAGWVLKPTLVKTMIRNENTFN